MTVMGTREPTGSLSCKYTFIVPRALPSVSVFYFPGLRSENGEKLSVFGLRMI